MSNKSNGRNAGQRPNKTILSRTLILMTVCGIVAFIVLAVKLYQIQIVKHDYYENMAVEQQTREATVTAARGTIYDKNGKVLAMSASVETVFLAPKETKLYEEDQELIARGLSEILGVDYETVMKKMEKNTSYETIKRKIEQDLADQVRQFIKDNGIKSVHIEPDTKRYYPYSSLACHIIGFVGVDNYGLNGLELQYEKYLAGVNGRIVRLKNANGTDMLFTDFEDYYDAKNGSDVTLTLDATIQYYVEKYLAQAIEDYDVQNGGACIAMDPKTGELLALASFDNFDLNNYLAVGDEEKALLEQITDEEEKEKALSDARNTMWRDKAVSDTYEPGSVFKIITMAMALEEGLVDLNDTYYCSGHMDVLGRTEPLKCWKTTGHGSQTLVEAMQHSCNVALVSIGLKVGAEKFYEYIRAFGFREKTTIDLPGESGPIWWPDSEFKYEKNLSSLAAASFGQTFKITPIQLVTAVSSVINGGYLMEPYIVKQIADADGNVVVANEPETIRQVISAETSKTMCEMLEAVVGGKEGTGKNAYVPGYRVGGKTGTSEKIEKEYEEGEVEEYIVSFCGIAPMDDPQVVILLLLDTPTSKSGVYISGGNMAAPVVGNIMSEVLPYLGVEPIYTEEELAELEVSVPKVTEKTVDEATKALKAEGFTVRVVGSGANVTDQIPAANAVVDPGTEIVLYADAAKPDDVVKMPNLYGQDYDKARKTLEALGLYIRSAGTLSSNAGAAVSTQSITSGEEIPVGSVIEVTLVDKSIQGHY